jgi:ABC transporter, permease protein
MLKNRKSINVKKGMLKNTNRNDFIFYCIMIAFPVLQFCIFYIGVNFNSLLLVFQKIDVMSNTITWTLTDNIVAALSRFKSVQLVYAAKNSIVVYLLTTLIGMPLGLLFSYYIYKKMAFSGTFRVLLFLPSIISAIVMITIFQFFVERAVPEIFKLLFDKQIQGLIENPSTRFGTILFYNIWAGFGTSVLMYSDSMATISEDIVDSAHLDGATGIKEFWYIALPGVYPTLSTFIIVGVAGIFTNQFGLFSFYGASAPENLQTFGYYLYTKTQGAVSQAEYPVLAAFGICFTVVAVPLTLLVKWVTEKFGPSED